jgi:hypothetical protein
MHMFINQCEEGNQLEQLWKSWIVIVDGFKCKNLEAIEDLWRVLGVDKLWCTQLEANLESHIVSKVATCKISLPLNNFKNHI